MESIKRYLNLLKKVKDRKEQERNHYVKQAFIQYYQPLLDFKKMIFEIPEELTHKDIKAKLVKTKENTL